jgi:LacI family transcriptional regulator
MGYRPNAIARALRSGRFNAVGFISGRTLSRSVPPELTDGVDDEVALHNLHLVGGRYPDEGTISENTMPKLLRELLVDGMLFNYTKGVPPDLYCNISSPDLPSVWLNVVREFDGVRPDDYQGGQIGAEYLLSLGHRRITYFDPLHSEEHLTGRSVETYHYSAIHRYQGYMKAMTAAGLPPRLISRPSHLAEQDVIPILLETMRRPDRPTAILGYCEYGFGPLLLALGDFGLRFPQDLSLLLFAHHEYYLAGLPMDTVVVPHYEVGRHAVKMLLKKIESPQNQFPEQIIPCKLYRAAASVAPPRI